MERFFIRLLEGSDVKTFAYELMMIERWNYLKEDVERMFKYSPLGCFVAHVEGKLLVQCIEIIELDEKLYVGVPAVNKAITKILTDLDFKRYSKSIRMYFGEKLETEHVDGAFAVVVQRKVRLTFGFRCLACKRYVASMPSHQSLRPCFSSLNLHSTQQALTGFVVYEAVLF